MNKLHAIHYTSVDLLSGRKLDSVTGTCLGMTGCSCVSLASPADTSLQWSIWPFSTLCILDGSFSNFGVPVDTEHCHVMYDEY